MKRTLTLLNHKPFKMAANNWKFDYDEAKNSPIFRAESTARCAIDGKPAPQKNAINLTKGWPNPQLHPKKQLLAAAEAVFSDETIITPALQYGPDPGFQPLRESIATWLSQYYGAEDNVDRICITGGASQNVANVLAGFTDPNITKRIWMMSPTYYLASRVFEDAGYAGRLRAVPEDEGGMNVEFLAEEMEKLKDEEPRGPVSERFRHYSVLWLISASTFSRDEIILPDFSLWDAARSLDCSVYLCEAAAILHRTDRKLTCKQPTKSTLSWRKTYSHIIYCVPTFSNPSTRSMTESRRRELVKVAAKYNALVITDDVYDFLHFPMNETIDPSSINVSAARALLPRISDVERTTRDIVDPDGFGFTMSNGSFSKILGPGVRTGWADCNPKLAYGLSQVGASKSGGAPSQLTATFIDQMVRKGTLQTHIAKTLLPAYQRRWKLMDQAIQQHLNPLGAENPLPSGAPGEHGGYFTWLQLPQSGINSDMVALQCLWEHNLIISQGRLFKVAGDDILDQDKFLEPCIRLTFAYEAEENLAEGVKRVAEIVKDMLTVRETRGRPLGQAYIDGTKAGLNACLHVAQTVLDGLPRASWDPRKEEAGQEELMQGLEDLESMLPSMGGQLRAFWICGVDGRLRQSQEEEVFGAARELDERVRKCRAKLLAGWSEVEVQEWCAKVHAASSEETFRGDVTP